MKQLILFSATVFFLLSMSGCATALSGKYQHIAIHTNEQNQLLIEGEKPLIKKGKYPILRSRNDSRQITAKRKGYKDKNIVMYSYRRTPLTILSWIPFGVFMGVPPLLDEGTYASKRYEREIEIGKKMVLLPTKGKGSKEVKLHEVTIDLKEGEIKEVIFKSYSKYRRNINIENPKDHKSYKKFEIESELLVAALDDVLLKGGYIDTTSKVFRDSYLDNLLLNATIEGYTLHKIWLWENIYYVDLSIKWEFLDYYKKTVFSQTITATSDQFTTIPEPKYRNDNGTFHAAVKDAMAASLIELLNSKEAIKLLHDRTQQQAEVSRPEIIIPAADVYVSSPSQAIQSSVTIKNKDGHGSGFVISSDGYIITNHHVIAEKEDLKVVMNDESEYDVKVVRSSPIADLALLKIEKKGLVPFRISESKEIEMAADIFAVGTPTAEDLSQSVSKGIISGIRKTSTNSKLIQTDASINSGNSGGAIINPAGIVLGVVSSKLQGFGIEGVAFGVPAYEIFEHLKIRIK